MSLQKGRAFLPAAYVMHGRQAKTLVVLNRCAQVTPQFHAKPKSISLRSSLVHYTHSCMESKGMAAPHPTHPPVRRRPGNSSSLSSLSTLLCFWLLLTGLCQWPPPGQALRPSASMAACQCPAQHLPELFPEQQNTCLSLCPDSTMLA